MDKDEIIKESIVTPELYFLISKFLSAGPLQETAKVLVRELEEKKVLPKRTDWLGVEHEQSFAELEKKYSHIGENHLLGICCRVGSILDKELTPSVPGILSLLGTGRQSLLRTKESIFRPRSLLDYCTRLHGVSLADSSVTKPINNLQKVLIGREYGGPIRRKLLVPTSLYSKTRLLRRTVGHLSSVYCVLFDRTGRYIITGADDLLIKIWSAVDGRLLATLRGASAEITDIAINLDNTMLAAGSLDRILRVWDLQTTSPIAVLTAHTGMITSVNFCPSPRGDLKYLVTTSTDGSIAFWQYMTPRGAKTTFAPKPIQYHEKLRPGQAQMMCTSFSPGGMFLAAGSADHHARVYLMSEDGPKRILETEAYTDAVDSVQWSHRGLRFISGSKDGTAHIWSFESQQWKSMKLCMTEKLASCPEPEEGKKLKVTMVAWDCSDKYVITAVNDFTIKIWNSKTAILHGVLRGHKDELYVLESNPKDEHVLLSAGHDGQVFLWDIEEGNSVAHFVNNIDGQGHGGVFDAKWSPDGTMIAATDSHGHILIFGLGIGQERYKNLPTELFFHTDYRPLLRDAQHYVVDEQTQLMPHLMPPPFLVDVDGNPHPPAFQKLVPGRENCPTDQLIPNIVMGPEGVVIEDSNPYPNANANGQPNSNIDRLIAALANRQGAASFQERPPANANHSHIDRLIEALANRQGQDQAPDSNNRSVNESNNSARGSEVGYVLGGASATPRNNGNDASSVSSGRLSAINRVGRASGDVEGDAINRVGRASGDVEGIVRAAVGSLQRDNTFKYIRRIYIRPMKYSQLQYLKQTVYAAGQYEMEQYKRELRRRPIMINTSNANTALQTSSRQRGVRSIRRGQRTANGSGNVQVAPAYRTRAVRGDVEMAPPEEEEEDDSSNSSGDTSYSNVEQNLDESSSTSDSESSDYSDWVADKPGPNLEPPKRSKRKPLSRRRSSSRSSDASRPNTSSAATTGPDGSSIVPKSRRKKVQIPPPAATGEIPEVYRPAEWLSEVIPRKTPYYPQMGDEVVYFRQGHHRYLEAVRSKKVYKLTHSSEPWNFRELRDHELVRVIGIKYEIRPPRLCCLKLAMVDEDGNMTGVSFKIKYHDMPDVLDFLVLRQTFDLAVQRNWVIGDRFRCMIGDGWWMGQIESRHSLSPEFPDSYFMCFRVRWDNGEYEYMSPWDMEPIDENRLPDEVGGAVPVLAEEIRATLYQPKSEEWHRGDRDGSCRRIINGLEQVMRLSIAEHFLAPVDLNIYPDYAYLIEYPIDLTTIKSRFENHFYRRITSAQFDVRYLATNAEQYNRSHTNIVKHARIITDLCLRVIREQNDIDVAAVYHQLVDIYRSSDTENDETEIVPSTSTGPSTSAAARKSMATTRSSNRIRSDGDWRSDCRQLLDMMWLRPDSVPFREPVDTLMFPDYLQIIDTPMDLRTVKEDLLGGNYEDPIDFAKDVRLIFQNSKNYNTNKRSRIYSMTLRLSALFESHMKTVITNWKAARRRANKSGTSSRGNKRTPPERNKPGPSKRQTANGRVTVSHRNSNAATLNTSEEDDDDHEEERNYRHHQKHRNQRSSAHTSSSHPRTSHRIRNGNSRLAATSSSNRVTSSSSHQAEPQQPGPSGRNLRRNMPSRPNSKEIGSQDNDFSVDSSTNTTEGSTGTSASDSESESNDGIDVNPGTSDGRRKKQKVRGGNDSEDSYKPNDRNQAKNRRKTPKKKNTRPPKRGQRIITDDEDDNEDDDDDDDGNSGDTSGGSIKRNRRQQGGSGSNTNHVRRIYRRRRFHSSDAVEDDGNQRSNRRRPVAAATATADESTQDASTPKKKGRPPKNHVSADGNVPSGSQLLLDSPSRGTRHIASRRSVAETDHSYHLPLKSGRIAESDTEHDNARPTRSSARKAILEWARGSDVDDEEEEAEEILPITRPSVSKRSVFDGNFNAPSTSRAASMAMEASRRQLRTNRNTCIESGEEHDGGGSENEPLATNQNSQQRYKFNDTATSSSRNAVRSGAATVGASSGSSSTQLQNPHLQRRSAVASTSSASVSHKTRSNAATTTMTSNDAIPSSSSSVAASSSSNIRTHPAQVDHNYMGESVRLLPVRNTRRVISRHQRNADELDLIGDDDPLENSALLLGNISSRLRRQNVATSSTTVRRGRSRYTQENNLTGRQDEGSAEEEEDDDDDDAAVSDKGTVGGGSNNSSDDNEEDDSEDNQPLTSYVPERYPKSDASSRMAAASSSNSRQHLQRKRRIGGRYDVTHNSEDLEDDDDDDDDYRVYDRSRATNSKRNDFKNSRSNNRKSNQSRRQQQLRGSRNQKRPRYNEETDEDTTDLHGKRKRGHDALLTNGNTIAAATDICPAINEQNHQGGLDNSSDGDSNSEQVVSVSSRGRVRKITAKARGLFKE